ncbi:hypothetical protein [Actinomadura rudentiformis]|uniref:hypothetical protein n=1 Tax=Actinomadura rudentiformis TaxID=359158 RepID=UPI00178C1DC5|nr:hypothetical protein [Actinomadura rudentiformis]
MAQNINKLGKKGLKNKVRFAWWAAEESGQARAAAKAAASRSFDWKGGRLVR